jgi:hypothetical protein
MIGRWVVKACPRRQGWQRLGARWRIGVPTGCLRIRWPRRAGEEGFRLMEQWRLPGAPRENPTARTAFIVEGLSWYLTEEENARLLDDLASLAAPGSRLGIDIISQDHLESPASATFFESTSALRILWQFGTNDPTGFLAAHGWQAEVTDLDAFARRLGRWPPPDVPEDLAARADASGRSYLHQRQTRSASILLH